MVVGDTNNLNDIMSGIENTGNVKQHNHKKKLRQRFDIIRKLGQGTFGKVQLGINKETGQEVAIKTIKKSKIESEADLIRIRREIQIMSSVQHPNIIHIYEVFENREKMVLVMEYAAGGELYDYLSERKVLPEEEARRIFRQIATACYYCHKHKICHRDLKLENILLDENNNAKIADFGLSNVFDDQRLLSTFCGSPLYASPEIVKGTPYHGPEVDCWSLGVLLYTLVYGAMPFDGSNFKRLVKQISQGDYFEPAKPSPASPLIRDMLTVNPKHRADIEKICSHKWVNENYEEDCLDISEELASQTPVRLDLLLSLAPPPPQLESEKLVVTGDVSEEVKTESAAPARSQSVGSLMDLQHPAEKRIQDLIKDDKISPKRKLESTVSTDRANIDRGRRKDKIIKENTIADITVHGTINESVEDASMAEAAPLNKSLTQTLSKEMDVEEDLSNEGAACTELIEEAKKKTAKVKSSATETKLHNINEEKTPNNKENVEEKEEKPKKKVLKKKVLVDKNENIKSKTPSPQAEEPATKADEKKEESKPIERRRSRIFEAAEKFQNLISPTETKPTPIEKPKKIVIPGVSVDGFKKEFERKASLTSTSPPKLKNIPKRTSIDKDEPKKSPEEEKTEPLADKPEQKTNDQDRKERVKVAVNIISSALDKEGARKSKSRPSCVRKPPVPFGVSGRSASGNIGVLPIPSGPKPFIRTQIEATKLEDHPIEPIEEKTSSAEITLKSATLPRRKMTKAEIQLNYPAPKPGMEFKTEMAHNIEGPKSQRNEVVVPLNLRAQSLGPDTKASKERIIPIAFEKEQGQTKPPTRPSFSTRSGSLSRQSTQESDSETTSVSGEPIRKSPREYIIPIAVEGGGYVTPRAGSLEPNDSASTTSTMTNKSKSKIGRARRLNSLLSDRDSEDESSPFPTLHRHSSFGKDDKDEPRFHMHRLRSTRPKKINLEHADSVSSGEEDDDDGFEILTAENLFSTLLSRVRDLTQRLNVEDGGRPGFPSSRLLSHFDHGTNFWNLHKRMDPLATRHTTLTRGFSNPSSNASPWRRSVSRDLASDINSVFNENNPAQQRPRGDKKSKKENLNLVDLDLKNIKLTDEDALALSYLTPGLSRRIQKQLLNQLAPSEAKKLQRTLSSCNPSSTYEPIETNLNVGRRSVDRLSKSTYPAESEKLVYKSNLPVKFDRKSPIDDDYYRKTRPLRSMSLREPKIYNTKIDKSPESSLSESLSKNDDDSTSYSSLSRPSSYSKHSDNLNLRTTPCRFIDNKTELKKPSTSPRRISRFLRPDFFDTPKEENILVKEKKEREMETQKVLKEIRDKRKSRFRRDRSASRDKQKVNDTTQQIHENVSKFLDNKTEENKQNYAKNLEKYSKSPEPEVLNKNNQTKDDKTNEKEDKSKVEEKIHDYVNVPGEQQQHQQQQQQQQKLPDYVNVKKPQSKISKLARPRSYPADDKVVQESKIVKLKKVCTKDKSKEDKNELNEEEKGHKNKLLQSIERKLERFRSNKNSEEKGVKEKKSSVENAIKRLREQSLPRNLEHCTESGLIKRAVSVEDLPNLTNKPLQASRKSVTKILGLFKKYEEQEKNNVVKKKKKDKEKEKEDTPPAQVVNTTKPERPKSLLLDKIPTFQNGVKDEKKRTSKLPVNSFRRSLNLERVAEAPKVYQNHSNAKLDFIRVPEPKVIIEPPPCSSEEPNRNSIATDDSSTLLSPCEDNMSDSWSVCSDLHSPISPNGYANICSGDENESVIDRIRRKSFYTRFNEKKRPRKPSLTRNYDLYYDYKPATSSTTPRRSSYDYYQAPTASSSSRRMNDYVNVPKYQTYSSKIGRPASVYSDSEDVALDDYLAAAKSRKYSTQPPSRLGRTSVSPVSEYYISRPASSIISNITSPTSSEPI